MRPPRPSLEPSTAELYGQHWAHVLRLLLGCGIPAQDAEDVAQAVWLNVHRRRDSYDAQIHKTPRAWAAASLSLGAAKLAGVLLLAFLSGAGTGAGCVGAWGAREHVRPAMDAARVATALRSTPGAPSTLPSSMYAVTSTLSTGPGAVWTSPRAIPSTSAAPSVSTGAAVLNEDDSQRLLARMRAAVLSREFATVSALADEHARRFGTMHLREREALRIKALRAAGQTKDAEERARAVIVTHPEHRGAMEHAAGQALP